MKIILLGAAGFIGTNLTIRLAQNKENEITVVDQSASYFTNIMSFDFSNVSIVESGFDGQTDFETLLKGQEVVFHLVSTTVPTTSNQHIEQEMQTNVISTIKMLDACVKNNVKKVVFISSGGTVYGKNVECPIKETTPTNPISAYGIQKITIEKLLYLYHHMYGLDYRVARLSNPYGPYQRPNGILGAVTTFTHRAIHNSEILVYGDGSVVRDYIYIDDAIEAILKMTYGDCEYKTFNIGSGTGTSINQLLESIATVLQCKLDIKYAEGRNVDVPINYLDVDRFQQIYGKINTVSLEEGILKTAAFLKQYS